MRKKAFTLAELLIALAIVGIIAALTLPSLTKMKQEAGAGPQLSKVKASVEDAAGRIFMEDPSVKLSDYTNFAGKISEYLVMTETTEAGKYRLKDGVVISFAAPSGSVSNASGTPFKDVLVDLNGSNMPNADGVDKFKFTLSSQGLMVPQGCAAKLASNNWKASKDYDSATCSAYTLGETIPDTIGDGNGTSNSGGSNSSNSSGGSILCPDGSTIPANMTCNCTKTCTGELETLDPVTCECKTTKQKCWDGSIIELSAKCTCDPAEQTACTNQAGKLWNNTTCQCYDDPNYCPVKTCTELQSFDEGKCSCVTDKKKCDDGEIIPLTATCPEKDDDGCSKLKGQAKLACECREYGGTWMQNASSYCKYPCKVQTCTELQTWDESSCSCKTTEKKCDDGSTVALNASCPVVCKKKTCTELQSWNESSCSCVTDKKKCEDGSIVAKSATCPTVCKKKTCTELQTWNESSCSCVTDKKKCEDGSIISINATCPVVCKTQSCGCGEVWNEKKCTCLKQPGFSKSCSELQVWDDATCSCKTTKQKCSDGSIIDIRLICPTPVACQSRLCSVGYYFDTVACNCVKRTGGSNGGGGGSSRPSFEQDAGGTTVGFDENGDPFTLHDGGKHGSYKGTIW